VVLTVDGVVGHDHVVQNLDAQERAACDEPSREGEILLARMDVTRRMAVEQDHARGPVNDGRSEDVPRAHDRARGLDPIRWTVYLGCLTHLTSPFELGRTDLAEG
jgi:hypothetical protein